MKCPSTYSPTESTYPKSPGETCGNGNDGDQYVGVVLEEYHQEHEGGQDQYRVPKLISPFRCGGAVRSDTGLFDMFENFIYVA